jgi:hypothetical protein
MLNMVIVSACAAKADKYFVYTKYNRAQSRSRLPSTRWRAGDESRTRLAQSQIRRPYNDN